MAHGDICHIELSTTDVSASKAFYREVFGWTFEDAPGMEGYTLFRTPGGLGGGMNAGPGAEAPIDKGLIIHIETDDIAATLAQIPSLGGRVLLPKTKISNDFGYFALFLDNAGNRLGLWART